MPNSKTAASKRKPINHVGDPTIHLAKKLQANHLHQIRRESAMRATRVRGGGRRKNKSLWKQLKALFTRKRK